MKSAHESHIDPLCYRHHSLCMIDIPLIFSTIFKNILCLKEEYDIVVAE